jgi:hypothetical protein
MMYDRAPFWGRYCVTSVVAIYFLVALLVAHGLARRVRAGHFAVAAASLALIAGRMIAPTVQNLLHPRPTNAAFLAKIRPDLPIVAASGMTFVEMGQYEAPSLSSRLFYLLDRSAAIRFAHATIFEDLGDFQKTFDLRGHVEPYIEFTRRHRDFLVFGTADYPEDWLLRKLASDKAAVVRPGSYETPYKDKTVFEIHLRRESLASDRIEDPVTAHGISKS